MSSISHMHLPLPASVLPSLYSVLRIHSPPREAYQNSPTHKQPTHAYLEPSTQLRGEPCGWSKSWSRTPGLRALLRGVSSKSCLARLVVRGSPFFWPRYVEMVPAQEGRARSWEESGAGPNSAQRTGEGGFPGFRRPTGIRRREANPLWPQSYQCCVPPNCGHLWAICITFTTCVSLLYFSISNIFLTLTPIV